MTKNTQKSVFNLDVFLKHLSPSDKNAASCAKYLAETGCEGEDKLKLVRFALVTSVDGLLQGPPRQYSSVPWTMSMFFDGLESGGRVFDEESLSLVLEEYGPRFEPLPLVYLSLEKRIHEEGRKKAFSVLGDVLDSLEHATRHPQSMTAEHALSSSYRFLTEAIRNPSGSPMKRLDGFTAENIWRILPVRKRPEAGLNNILAVAPSLLDKETVEHSIAYILASKSKNEFVRDALLFTEPGLPFLSICTSLFSGKKSPMRIDGTAPERLFDILKRELSKDLDEESFAVIRRFFESCVEKEGSGIWTSHESLEEVRRSLLAAAATRFLHEERDGTPVL